MRRKLLFFISISLFLVMTSTITFFALKSNRSLRAISIAKEKSITKFVINDIRIGLKHNLIDFIRNTLKGLQEDSIYQGAIVFDQDMDPILTTPKMLKISSEMYNKLYSKMKKNDQYSLRDGYTSYQFSKIHDKENDLIGNLLLIFSTKKIEEKAFSTLIMTIVIGLLVIFPILIIIGWKISHMIKPLDHAIDALEAMSEGQLNQEIKISGEDEAGRILSSLHKTITTLRDSQDRLVSQEKLASVGQMTAGVAHEIKNPIYIILNSTDLIGECLSNIFNSDESINMQAYEEHKDELSLLIKMTETNCFKVNNIINNMLSLTRGENQVLSEHSLSNMFSDAAKFCYIAFKGKHQFECYTTFQIDNIGMFLIWKDDLTRVLVNIIDNAYYALKAKKAAIGKGDYTPELNLKLYIEGENMVFQIEDNGNGIPENIKNKIFDPFFTSKPTGDGTGLGLSIAYDVIKKHDGEIRVDSVKNQFTRFTIVIPKLRSSGSLV